MKEKYDAGILKTSYLSTGIIFSYPESRETGEENSFSVSVLWIWIRRYLSRIQELCGSGSTHVNIG